MKWEWPTFLLIVATYGLWALSGAYLWPQSPAAALAVMAVCTALHSSLVHEVLHGHPSRHPGLNELLVTWCLGLILPYRRYKQTHLKHHNNDLLTDPQEDPESYFLTDGAHAGLPGWLKGLYRVNNTLVGRMIFGPWIATIRFLMGEARLLKGGGKPSAGHVLGAWVLHALSLIPVVGAIVLWFEIPLWLYLLTVSWGGMALIAIRTFAEHRWHENPDGRTIIVEKSPLAFLYLFNNLHIVHHRLPAEPWYRIPALYKEKPEYWQQVNTGYVYQNYWTLFRLYGLRIKNPVVHPALPTGA